MKKMFGGKSFIKYALALSVPALIQQTISALAQLVDNVMVGGLGEEAVAAVGIANQISFVIMITCFAIAAACGIFISQYMGAKNTGKVQEAFRINLIVGALFGIFVFLSVNIFTEEIIRLFVSDNELTISLAVGYMKNVSFTYVIFPVIVAYSTGFRYEGRPKYALYMSVTAVIINTILNYCLIYGNFGFNEYGVNGAAYATVIARVVELSLGLLFSVVLKTNIYTKFRDILKFDKKLLQAVASRGSLVIANEIIWVVSIVVLNVLYSAKISDNITALQINSVVSNIAYIGSGGLSTAIGVIVGNELGKSNFDEAIRSSKYLIKMSVVLSLCIVGVLFVIAPQFPKLYDVSGDISKTATMLIIISASVLVFRYVEMSIFFVVRSGGDTRGVFLMDSGYMWCVTIPFVYLASLTSLPLLGRVICGSVIMFPKLFLTLYIYKKRKWLKNITV